MDTNATHTSPPPAAPYFQRDFSQAEFANRRARVAEAIGAGAMAVVRGFGESGAYDVFRQSNDFYYLCGVEVPHAYLAIDGGDGSAVLYLPPCDPKHERMEGPQLNCDHADLVCRLTGVESVRPLGALARDVRGAAAVYTPSLPAEGRQACRDVLRRAAAIRAADPWAADEGAEDQFRRRLAAAAPSADVRDLTPILDDLRLVKSDAELAVMRRAGRLTAAAVTTAMRATQPGVVEYELAALAEYVYLAGGARGAGYRPIVAGGANIWNAHYYRNNCPLRPGDLVLMDAAPDCGNYTSDIGRMWPVDGRYTPAQRELYGYIVEYHKALLRLIRPGVTAAQVMAEAADDMAAVVAAWRWSKPAYEAAARRTLEFKGHLSHGVGMAVHDAGDYHAGPLRPGVVFALDPQMWVPEEQLYIRVEDTVAVMPAGVENFTAAAPLELDDVEALIAAGAAVPPGSPAAVPPPTLQFSMFPPATSRPRPVPAAPAGPGR